MIRESTGDRERFEQELKAVETESQGQAMIERLRPYCPIMGLHKLPTRDYEISQAVRYMIDKDNFYERNSFPGDR